MTSVSIINSTKAPAYSIEESQNAHYWTTAKLKKLALYFFAALLLAGAVATAVLAPTPFGFLSIPLLLLSLGLGYVSYKIKDYHDLEKLNLYRQEAVSLTFQQLVDEHGLKNIMQYRILPLEEVREKFNRQVQTMDFSAVLNAYNTEELIAYEIATPDHIALLRKLKVEADKYRAQYYAYVKELDLRYSGRADRIKQKIHQGKLVVDSTAAAAAGPNARDRVNAFATANAVTTPLAFVGDIIADEVGRESQFSFDQKMAKGRIKFHEKMTALEEQYNQFKKGLV